MQLTKSFDDIGNRKQTQVGGDQSGANQRLANYSVNNLNQITRRDYPGANDIVGVAWATNWVRVNGQTAWRKGEYFWSTVCADNHGQAQWLGVTVVSGGNTNKGNLYFPQTPEEFSYDADGNLTNDGRWSYVWDAENRLIQMTVNTNVGPQYQLTFAYDPQGRRIEKIVLIGGVPQSTNLFLYDGWNLIGELAPNDSLIRSYVWGTDLSGSPQGAGGVGGLVEMSYAGTNCFVAYDGNGNVAALVNAADGTVAANYEYGPFGEVVRQTGPMAKANPFRFSTKYQDNESDLVYYGYRYYDPSMGRWLSRDPIEEDSGLNLYGFVSADPIGALDELGLDEVTVSADAFIPWEWVQLPSPGPYYLQIKGDGRLPGSSPPSIASHDYRMAQTLTVELLASVSVAPIKTLGMGISTSTRRLVDSSGKVVSTYTHPAHIVDFTLTAKRLSCNSVEVDIQMSGRVDWRVAGPQPPIDYSYKVVLTQDGSTVSYDLTADHDGFPAHEFFIDSSASTKVNFYYVPIWFTSVPPGLGSIATPTFWQSVEGTLALAGRFMHQHYTEHNSFTVP